MKSSNKKQNQGKVQFQRWNSRFSVGGANRTNIHQQIRRLSRENDVSPDGLPHYHQPTSSNRLPYDRYRYRASERQNSNGDEEQEYNLSNYRDSKGRPLQRVGLFRNAKHSDVILPNVDERVMRNAEAKIRRLTRRESGEEEDCRYDDESRNPVRERVRQVVYEMNGNPGENFHQVPRRRAEVVARQLVYSPQPPRRYSNPRRNVLYDSGYEPRSPDIRRDNYYENDNEDYNRPSTSRQYQNDYYQHRSPDIRQEHRLASPSPPPPQTLSRSQNKSRKRQQNSPNTSIGNRNNSYLSNQAQQSPEIQEVSDEDEKQKESENDDIQEKSDEEEENDPEHPHSRLSDASNSSKKLNTSYSPEEDEFTQWKKASGFFNTLDGEASAIIDRIGNSMPHLPLNDESEKCYSKIAFSLIFKSLQNQKNDKQAKKSTGDVFTNLVNMSTSWIVPSHQYSTILAGGGENFEEKKNKTNDEEEPINTVVFGDISKFQNPQNLLLDDSKFPTSSRFLEPAVKIATKNMRKRKTPLFQSSPISNDVVRSNEISTMPSEIPNSQVIEKIKEKEDEIESEEEEEEEREYDMDRYIDKGASQLTYIGTPEIQSTSKTTFRFMNSDEIVLGTPEEEHNPKNRNVQIIPDDQAINSSRNDFEIQPSATSNQPFNFTFSNQKSINSTKMDVDVETQKLFENAFEEYQDQKKKEENRKYQF